MNYEEKYKQALERAMKLRVQNPFDTVGQMVEHIFPELKESEDEQIRKELIAFIKKRDRSGCDYDYDKWIAWLEKQGEQKPIDYNEELKKCRENPLYFIDKYVSVKPKNQKPTWSKEDERIRKNCIHFLELQKSHHAATFEIDECIAWLEKQDEQEETLCDKCRQAQPSHSCQDISALGRCYAEGEQKSINKVEPRFNLGDKIRKKNPRQFDKDMEVARIGDDYYLCNHIGKFSSETIPFSEESNYELIEQSSTDGREGIEKQDGQETTDKVEPKFKVGDWFTENKPNNYARFIQILDIVDNEHYKISRDIHDDEDILEARFIKEYYHPFSIEDAKDGDVLCYEDEISLFKHDIKNCTKREPTFGGFVYHCCYDGKRFITDSLYSLTEENKINIHPATKEQRDLLFKKMKEAGLHYDYLTRKFYYDTTRRD